MNDTNGQNDASFCVNTDGQAIDTRVGNISSVSAVPDLFARDSDIAEATALFCAALSPEPLVVERPIRSECVEGEENAPRQQRDVTSRIWAGLADEDVLEPNRQRPIIADPIQARSVNARYDIDEQIRKFFR